MSNTALSLQISQMLSLQNDMNAKVHPQWQEQEFPFYRALWTECAELMDHYGWKWWKKQDADLEQIQLEIIDIWHFGLSMELQKNNDLTVLTATLAQKLSQTEPQTDDFRLAVENLASKTLSTKHFDLDCFVTLMLLADLSTDALFKQYVGKNVLNFFRQDNGYKDGSYIKVWNGQEDNEHLAEIVAGLDSTTENFPEIVYQALQAKYPVE